ncbi:MAG TPA: hypothetical protein VHK01_01755, partial [Lacipirellulaceae bacterium]|nr:hypothetical protein [Lacipirellulaceae bacterium]
MSRHKKRKSPRGQRRKTHHKRARVAQKSRLHVERLEERWLLNSQSVIESDPFSDDDMSVAASGGTGSFVPGMLPNIQLPAFWNFEGPAPLENSIAGGHFNLNPNIGSGAIETIAPHPNDPKTIYVGTVSGGIWKTTTADQSIPHWIPLTDFEQSLSISSIAISPVDLNEDGTQKFTAAGTTIYAGTGDLSSGRYASGDAIGVMRSTDGENFTLLPGSSIFAAQGLKIRSVVPLNVFETTTNKQVVLVAAHDSTGKLGGVYRSTEAGENFVRISGLAGSGLPAAAATHLVPDLSLDGIANNRVYAAVIGNSFQTGIAGVYVSQGPNVGLTWTKISAGIPEQRTLDFIQRIELAVSKADGTLYVALLGNITALRAPVDPNDATVDPSRGVRLRVEAPDLFRSGDQIAFGVFVSSTIKTANNGENKVTLQDVGLNLRPGDQLTIEAPGGAINVKIVADLGGGEYRIDRMLTRNVPPGTVARTATEVAYVVPGGVDFANRQITIDRLPETAGIQGAQRAFGAGHFVSMPGRKLRAVMLFQSKDHGTTWRQVQLPRGSGERDTVRFPFDTAKLTAPWLTAPGLISGEKETLFDASETGLHPGGQADRHFSMLVTRTGDNDVLFLGGDRQPLFNSANTGTFSGRLFAGRIEPPATPGGALSVDWAHLVGDRARADRDGNGIPETRTGPHADSRELVFAADGTILEGDDGGIVRFTLDTFFNQSFLIGGNLGEWSSVSGNLGTTEFYSIAYDSFQDKIFGGTQDNGTPLQKTTLSTTYIQAIGGDGTISAVRSSSTNSTRYYVSQRFGIDRAEAKNPVGPVTSQVHLEKVDAHGKPLENFDFVQQWALNATDDKRILVEHPTPINRGQEGTLYEMRVTDSRLVEVRSFSRQMLKTTGMDLTAAKYGFVPADNPNGANRRPDLIYAGFTTRGDPTNRGRLFFRETGTGAPVEIEGYRFAGGKGVRDIAVDPFDFRKIVVIDALGQVWRSDDLFPGSTMVNATFTNVTGTLTELTGGDIRSVEIVNLTANPGDELILVGGLRGVYRLNEEPFNPIGALSFRSEFQWYKFGLGMPHVLVTDVMYDPVDDILLAGTWGRGIWSVRDFKDNIVVVPDSGGGSGADLASGADLGSGAAVVKATVRGGKLTIQGTPGDDVLLVRPKIGNPALLEILADGVVVATPKPIELLSFSQLVFNGLAGDDHFIITSDMFFDFTIHNVRGLGVTYDGGGGFNRLLITEFGPSNIIHDNGASGTIQIIAQPVFYQNVDEVLDGTRPQARYGLGLPRDPIVVRLLQFANGITNSAAWSRDLAQERIDEGRDEVIDWFKWLITDDLARKDNEAHVLPEAQGTAQGTLAQGASGSSDTSNGTEEIANGAIVVPDEPNVIKGTIGLGTSEILSRLFETGPNALVLEELGTTITTVAQLVERLDALGDVTIVEENENGFVLDVEVTRRLQADTELAIAVLDGALELGGNVTLSGDVTAKLRLGVDQRGFFIDADAFSDPEIVIRNLAVTGDIRATGKVGFLGVTLDSGTLEIDDQVAIEINIQDPGMDPLLGIADGVVRVHELAADASTMSTVNLRGNNLADDVIFTAKLSAQPLVAGLSPLFGLADASLEIRFADINNPNLATVTAASSAGQELIDFLNADIPAIVDGIRQVAATFETFSGVDLLAAQIPLLNKSIGEVLEGVPQSLKLGGNAVLAIGETIEENGAKSFSVDVDGIHLVTTGVAVGDKVSYRGSNGSAFEGVVATVSAASLTVSFAGTLNQEPDRANPQLEVFRGGGLGDQLAGLLGQSASTLVQTGTIQGLIEEIAQRMGIDITQFGLQSSGSGADRVVTISLPLDIEPFTFDESIDLSGQIPGLELSGAGNFQFQIDPAFNLTLGIRTASGISPAERIFIVDNDAPEVTLDISAQLDDPQISASLGLLDLSLREQSLAVNDGIKITGSITIDLDEPLADDGRITLGDLTAGSLADVLEVGIDANFDIDGLVLAAGGALAGLGSVQISLDGSGPGHVTSLEDLANLPSAIRVEGLHELLNFDNISELALQQILEQLRSWLDELRGSSIFAADLPLTDKTLGDLIDVGTAFFDTTVGVLDNPRLVAQGLGAADGRLPQDVSLTLKINDETDLTFTILASQTADNTDLHDLASDVRAALAFALAEVELPNALDVGIRQGALTIFAKTDDVKGLAVSAGNSLVGFAKDQIADAIGYRSLDEFFEILAQHLPGPLNPNYDAATNILTFTLSFDESFTADDETLAFGFELGSLAEIKTTSTWDITAQAMGSLRVGINLGDSSKVDGSTSLSAVNGAQGVNIPSDTSGQVNDLRITLRNGSAVEVNLDRSMSTLGAVVEAINNASPKNTNGERILTADIDPATRQAIRLTDTSTGGGTLSASSVAGSSAAVDLGMVGSDTDGDGVLVGQSLHGLKSTTPLARLKGGEGVVIPPDTPSQVKDLRITLRDGTTFDIDLASTMTTLGAVLEAISNASPTNASGERSVMVEIDPDTKQAIRLTDISNKPAEAAAAAAAAEAAQAQAAAKTAAAAATAAAKAVTDLTVKKAVAIARVNAYADGMTQILRVSQQQITATAAMADLSDKMRAQLDLAGALVDQERAASGAAKAELALKKAVALGKVNTYADGMTQLLRVIQQQITATEAMAVLSDKMRAQLDQASALLDQERAAAAAADVAKATANAKQAVATAKAAEAAQAKAAAEPKATFSISGLPGSLVAIDLGLVGSDVDGDGVLVGEALHSTLISQTNAGSNGAGAPAAKAQAGIGESSRFFIDPTNSMLGGNISLFANDISATARFGFADVSILSGSGSASASASVSLKDPGTGSPDGRITLAELFEALTNDAGSLITAQGPTGSATFDLPIRITLNGTPITPPGDPHLNVTMSNLFDPDTFAAAINPEFDLLNGLKDFAFAQLIAGLRQVQSILEGVESNDLLENELPLIDTSLADILELSGRFGRIIDRLEADQPRSLSQFQSSLQAAIQAEVSELNLPSVNVAIVLGQDSFDINLSFGGRVDTTIPLNFDLVSLGVAADNLVSLETGGQLNVGADATLNLGLAIDVSNPLAPALFVKDTTGFTASANVTGSNLSF